MGYGSNDPLDDGCLVCLAVFPLEFTKSALLGFRERGFRWDVSRI